MGRSPDADGERLDILYSKSRVDHHQEKSIVVLMELWSKLGGCWIRVADVGHARLEAGDKDRDKECWRYDAAPCTFRLVAEILVVDIEIDRKMSFQLDI